ncbi:hypothetical protein IO397_000962, partial [Campylobacter lari]|nr:hypothetical protein [Campylobacter lari]
MNSSLERLNAKENFNYSNTQRIKNIFLSLATISFLATCANSSVVISDPSSSGSIKISKAGMLEKNVSGAGCLDGKNCTINTDASTRLWLKNVDGYNIHVSNSGKISKDNQHAIMIDENSKNINIINNGSIIGGKSEIVEKPELPPEETQDPFVEGDGIFIRNNSHVASIINNNLIDGNHGILIYGGTIDKFTNNNNLLAKYDGFYIGNSKVTIIENKKTIQGSNFGILIRHSSTIDNINNSGLIQGLNRGGISIEYGSKVKKIDNRGSIVAKTDGIYLGKSLENLNNNGTIKGNNYGILVREQSILDNLYNSKDIISSSRDGITIEDRGKIKTLNNLGVISGEKKGLRIGSNYKSKGALDNLDNKGKILGKEYGLYMQKQSTLQNFTNKGTIQGATAIGVNNSTIVDFKNYGSIISTTGPSISLTNSTMSNFTNIAGINSQKEILNLDSSTIKSFVNSGVLNSQTSSMILKKSTLENLSNSGTIQGKQAGISFDSAIGGTLTNAGNIIGDINGINIDSASKVDSIILTSSNALIAGVNAGINNEGTIGKDDTSNAITLKQGIITALQNNRQINTAGNALINNGTIQGNISLTNNAKIIGTLKNTKTITGSIELNSNSQINTISNAGTINKDIKLNQSTITNINNAGTITNGINLSNKSAIGDITNSGNVNSITLANSGITNITNSG